MDASTVVAIVAAVIAAGSAGAAFWALRYAGRSAAAAEASADVAREQLALACAEAEERRDVRRARLVIRPGALKGGRHPAETETTLTFLNAGGSPAEVSLQTITLEGGPTCPVRGRVGPIAPEREETLRILIPVPVTKLDGLIGASVGFELTDGLGKREVTERLFAATLRA